jgi:hypothetical protein
MLIYREPVTGLAPVPPVSLDQVGIFKFLQGSPYAPDVEARFFGKPSETGICTTTHRVKT